MMSSLIKFVRALEVELNETADAIERGGAIETSGRLGSSTVREEEMRGRVIVTIEVLRSVGRCVARAAKATLLA